ncbi:MAG: hypothetical protein HOV97_05560 [Nonomuraea sp.]|nr:hypothetical protein [Nonomuraea sp.]
MPEIAVITKAEIGNGGNLACNLDVFQVVGHDPTTGIERTERVDPRIALGVRTPVFYPGEILILDESGREIGFPGRKPSKWSVEYQVVDSLDEARLLAERVMNGD